MERKCGNIKSYFDEIISEALENVKKTKQTQVQISEKEKQDALANLSQDTEKSEEKQKEDPEEKNDEKKLEKADVSIDDVIDKINTIRSGKSFKDSVIKSAFEKYFDDLEDAEKTALFAFLKGISQIVTGEISGELATEPSEDPASVQMKKDNVKQDTQVQKKSIKPNVIKTQITQPEKSSKTGVEDTSGPVIVPKKR